MSSTPPTGQWSTLPANSPQQPYSAYPPYPYPYQPQPYPYPRYRPVPARPPTQPNEGPLPEAPAGYVPGRFAKVIALVLGVVCLVAIMLAALAPVYVSTAKPPIPAGWGKVFDGAIHSGGVWTTTDRCTAVSAGLDASAVNSGSGVICPYIPSDRLNVLANGFYIEARLAPAAQVDGNPLPLIAVGNAADIYMAFDQEGAYRICPGADMPCHSGSTVAWHADGYVANTIALLYVPASDATDSSTTTGKVTFIANGQTIASFPGALPTNAPLSLGAVRHGEAIFTHVTLYLGSAS